MFNFILQMIFLLFGFIVISKTGCDLRASEMRDHFLDEQKRNHRVFDALPLSISNPQTEKHQVSARVSKSLYDIKAESEDEFSNVHLSDDKLKLDREQIFLSYLIMRKNLGLGLQTRYGKQETKTIVDHELDSQSSLEEQALAMEAAWLIASHSSGLKMMYTHVSSLGKYSLSMRDEIQSESINVYSFENFIHLVLPIHSNVFLMPWIASRQLMSSAKNLDSATFESVETYYSDIDAFHYGLDLKMHVGFISLQLGNIIGQALNHSMTDSDRIDSEVYKLGIAKHF